MTGLLLLLAACTEPAASLAPWAGRWSDGFHGMRIEACDPFLVIGWDDRSLLAYVVDGTAKPCIGCAEAWPGQLVLDGDTIHANMYELAFDAARIAPADDDPGDCPRRF